jgi:GNAT superfamily N-acetyltransferase
VYRPRKVTLRDGREVTLRPIVAHDAPEIVQAFERLSAESRYSRFLQHKEHLDSAALERGVHPRPGRDFVFVATIPACDGIDIVGAAQYVRKGERARNTCEFAITVADDWRGNGLATALLSRLIRRARRDGYATMEGLVLASNAPMLALALKLRFAIRPVKEDATVVRVQRVLAPARAGAAARSCAAAARPRSSAPARSRSASSRRPRSSG